MDKQDQEDIKRRGDGKTSRRNEAADPARGASELEREMEELEAAAHSATDGSMPGRRSPGVAVSFIPIVVLIGLLCVVINLFGSDSLEGGSQIALLLGVAVCVLISTVCYGVPWRDFERQMARTMSGIFVTLLILLFVGMLSGSWMVSGVVPTLIYYGIKILSPRFFLVTACVICSLVSLLSGSSWTTIATIGVALLGVGNALGIDTAWTAGAIVSGAYFGDKMSPLSDTTILASSVTRVDIFDHIRYMTITTVPALVITLVIFTVAGLCFDLTGTSLNVDQYTRGLENTFNISLWTLLVPVVTGVLIARKLPSLIVLFVSSLLAGVMALVLQPHILCDIAGDSTMGVASLARGLAVTFYGSTAIDTGFPALNDLVSTGGMAGMLNTIWLIICAMCFGAVMVASGMIGSITSMVIRKVRSRFSMVASTVCTGLFLNLTTGDQFISIVLTGDMFGDVYRRKGYEGRLLSRTTEDSATVTSVLVPWNTCGMTQATVLGVPTLTYLPYCFFNLLCPLVTLTMAALGWRIKQHLPVEDGEKR